MSLFNLLTNLINFINFNSRFWRRVCAESSPKLSRSSFLQSYNRCFYHTYANGHHGIQGANGRAKRKLQNSKTWNDKNSREVRRTCTRNQKQSSINWWVQVTYGTIHILCNRMFRLFDLYPYKCLRKIWMVPMYFHKPHALKNMTRGEKRSNL